MAARKKAPPSPRWQRVLENRTVQITLIVTAFSAVSFLFGTTRDLALAIWRHYSGAELAFKLAPEVQRLNDLNVTQSELLQRTSDRIDLGEKRLKQAERTLDEAQESKKIEQEREGAVEKAQRSACITGELSEDACHRLGYPTKQGQ